MLNHAAEKEQLTGSLFGINGPTYIHMLQHWLHVVNYILMSF